MIYAKKYLPVNSQTFYSPIIKENLRLELFSSDYKLSDLSLLVTLMLRDKRTPDEIVAVTELPNFVIENVLKVLKSQGILDSRNIYEIPEDTKKILALSDCINSFNLNAPPIYSDLLTNTPILLKESSVLNDSGDEANCIAVVKNYESTSTADFVDISDLVKNYLRDRGFDDLLDELKVMRFEQSTKALFVAREIRLLPVVGEDNLIGGDDLKSCVNIDSTRKLVIELPVRKFKLNDEREFYVDLLLGTVFGTEDNEQDNFEKVLLSFKPNPIYLGDEMSKMLFSTFGGCVEDKGIHYLKILVSEEMLGDFL